MFDSDGVNINQLFGAVSRADKKAVQVGVQTCLGPCFSLLQVDMCGCHMEESQGGVTGRCHMEVSQGGVTGRSHTVSQGGVNR